MLDDDVKQISLGALRQLELDLIQCERKFFFYHILIVSLPLSIGLFCIIIYIDVSKIYFIRHLLKFILNVEFAQSQPVKDLDPTLLLECFVDSRQILDLFNQCDFSSYFHDFGAASAKYSRVTPQAAIKVLEK